MAKQSLLSIILNVDSKDFDSKMKSSQKALGRFSKAAERSGRNLSRSLTAPIAAVGALATKTFVDFEKQVARVGAISGASGADLERLEKSALDLGSSTVFTATQVAQLQEEFSKLGFKTDGIIQATGDTLALAQAFSIDLAEAAELTGITLKQFNLQASDSGRVADVMATAFSNSALDAEKFREAMKTAGPVANSLGLSLEETTAALGLLADNGISGSLAGNALKRAFTELGKEGDDVKTVFRQLLSGTISFADANELLGARAAVLGTVLGGLGPEFDALTQKLNDSEGAAQGAADKINDTLAGSLASMQSAVEGAAIELGKSLAPIVKEVADDIRDLAKRFSELDDDTKKTIVQVAGFAAVMGPALIAVGKITQGVKALNLVLRANPIGLLVTGVTLLVANAGAIKDFFSSFTDGASAAERAAIDLNIQMGKEVAAADQLFGALERATAAGAGRKEAIDALNSAYPELLKNFNLEKGDQDEIKAAYDAVTKAVKNNAIAKFKAAKVEEFNNKQLENSFKAVEQINKVYGDQFTLAGEAQAKFFELSEAVKAGTISATRAAIEFSKFNREAGAPDVLNLASSFKQIAKDADSAAGAVEAADAAVNSLLANEPIGPSPVADPEGGDTAGGGKTGGGITPKPKPDPPTPDSENITPFGSFLDPSIFSGDAAFFQNIADQYQSVADVISSTEADFNLFGDLSDFDQAKAKLDALKSTYSSLSPQIQKSAEGQELFQQILGQQDKVKAMQAELDKIAQKTELVNTVSQAAGSGVGNAFGQLADNARESGNAVGAMALEIIGAAAAAAFASAIQIAFAPSADNIATGGLAAPVKAAALTASVGALFASIPAFAEGGMVTAPMLAMVGDNASRKEAIIPFEKMGSFLNEYGGGNVTVQGRLNGQDILISGQRSNRNRGR